MIYTLGADTSSDYAGQAAQLISQSGDVTSAIVNLKAVIKTLDQAISTAKDQYELAKLNKKRAEQAKVLAELQAEKFKKTFPIYAAGIGVGVIALAGIAFFG